MSNVVSCLINQRALVKNVFNQLWSQIFQVRPCAHLKMKIIHGFGLEYFCVICAFDLQPTFDNNS